MSVYTPVSKVELKDFLEHYSIGELVDFQGITDGIENTNYFLMTTGGDYVLTLFEKHTPDELQFFLDLMAFLAERGVPSPHPVLNRAGRYLGRLNERPAAIVQRLRGGSVELPSLRQCRAVGGALADLHTVGADFSAERDNDRGPKWWNRTARAVYPYLSGEDADLLRAEIDFQARFRMATLPRGVIHADLFRDNALFVDDRLTGIIDFYYACKDVLLYDLAVTANDWCSRPDGAPDWPRMHALLEAYAAHRPLETAERDAWPVMLRAAALRFWLSRLYDMHFPRAGELTHMKDPEVFKRILCDRMARGAELIANTV